MIEHKGESTSNAIRKRLEKSVGRGQRTNTPTLAVIARAANSSLWTPDGKRLLDFTSGVLVSNLGHNHFKFENHFRRYLRGLPRTSYNAVTPIEIEASERLIATMKDNPNAQKMLWAATGSEGIQKAMWAAMHRSPERDILVATRFGFHGKKGLAGDVSGETSPNPNVRFISFPMDDGKPQSFYQKELDSLAKKYSKRIALLITEPYLGAAGSFHPPKWYHPMLEAWCRKHGAPFIFDEVQSCHGRTGNMLSLIHI